MTSLIQELLRRKIIDKKKLSIIEREIKKSNKREEEVLLDMSVIDEGKLFEIKSEILNIPIKKDIFPDDIPIDTLNIIPEESAFYYKMIALARRDNVVEIGMVYPEDLSAQEAIKFLARQGGFEYKIFLLPLTLFDKIVKRYRALKLEVKEALGEIKEEEVEEKKPIIHLAEQAPISRIVSGVLNHAIENEASDIHIEPMRKDLRIRIRKDGILRTKLILPLNIASAIASRIKILSGMRIDETRVPQDGRFSMEKDSKNIDFRVSTFPTPAGEKVVIRILDPQTGLKGLSELGLSDFNLKLVKEAILQPFGMILATGPTGSGKTTTLYAILQELNKEGVNIVTLEDPIEYFIEGVNQSQVRPEIGYNFASGLRSILRQDPDVIMVGEIRDSETASLATHAALTGHIVLSTLHTNNAIGVIPRLIDLGVAPYILPPTLRLAIAQRLVRKLCPDCKKVDQLAKEKEAFIVKELKDLPPSYKKNINLSDIKVYTAVGCKRCHNEGYKGRIGIFEILEITEEIARIIPGKPSEDDVWQIAKKQGMITMRQDGLMKVLQGITSLEEVIRVTEQ